MKLEKYPITTNRQEYRVTIKESYDSWEGGDIYIAKVYIKHRSKILRRNKWRMVNRYVMSKSLTESKENWFITLSELAVRDYEDWLADQEEQQEKLLTHQEKFIQWDGNMTR